MSSYTDLYPSTGSSTIATGAGQAVIVWANDLWQYVKEMSFWRRFTGASGSGMPIILRNDLTRGAGETISIDLLTPLDAAPISNVLTAWQNEDSLSFTAETMKLGLVRQAVKYDYPMSQQRTIHDLWATQIGALKQWWIDYGWDYCITKHITGNDYADSASTAIGDSEDACTNIYYCGDATSVATITDSCTLNANDVWKLMEAARMGVMGSLTMRKFHPVMINGSVTYPIILHPYAVSALKHSAGGYWEDWSKLAMPRGGDNPLWAGTGNLAGVDPTPVGKLHGATIYEYSGMPLVTTGGPGGDVSYVEGVLLGGEAMIAGFGMLGASDPDLIEERGPYQEHRGLLSRQIMGAKKAKFGSYDNGVILIRSAGKSAYTNN